MPNAGLLELVAHGIQDIYLIGNPQITFFKTIYKRHTNFSMESYQISYDAEPTWGSKTTFTMTRYADLIYTMILEVDLPAIYAKTVPDPTYGGNQSDFDIGRGDISWINNTGHGMINYLDLKIGSNLIDRQYGEWMEIWTQLTQSESKKRGLDLMLNRNPQLISNAGQLKLYIPFQFWFCRNIGLALPLVALQYHDVQLEVNFRPLSQMFTFGSNNYYNVTTNGTTNNILVYKQSTASPNLYDSNTRSKIIVFPNGSQYYINPNSTIGPGQTGDLLTPYILQTVQIIPTVYTNENCYIKPNGTIDSTQNTNITELRLFVDYIYLDTFEQREFASAKHRYLIEQLQYSGSSSIPGNTQTNKVTLNFNLPVKELFWVNQLDDVYITNDLFNFSNTVNPVIPQGNIVDTGVIYINGIERFSTRSGNYFRLIQPYQKHTRSPNGFIYVYSFSVKPEEHQPSGCSNFSKLNTKEIYLTFPPNLRSQQMRVYGLNYNILRIYSGMGGIAFSN
jgi:hypothetical protein